MSKNVETKKSFRSLFAVFNNKFCFAGQPVRLPEHITTITNLIQFCHKFAHNSMHFKSPLPLTENETLPEQFELLAKKVIKNSLLEKHLMRPLFEAA